MTKRRKRRRSEEMRRRRMWRGNASEAGTTAVMSEIGVAEAAEEEVAVLGVVRTRGRVRARVHAPGTANGGDEPPAPLLVREAATTAGEARPRGGHVRVPARGIGEPVVAAEAAGAVPGPRPPRLLLGPAPGVVAGRPLGGGVRRNRVRRTGEKAATAWQKTSCPQEWWT